MCQFLYFSERSMFNYYFKFILQLWDTRTLTLLKTYVTQPPINAVAMSPLLDHVINLTLIMMLTIFWCHFISSLYLLFMHIVLFFCDFQVVLGGGQDANKVTTTDHRAGHFESKFFDKVNHTCCVFFFLNLFQVIYEGFQCMIYVLNMIRFSKRRLELSKDIFHLLMLWLSILMVTGTYGSTFLVSF